MTKKLKIMIKILQTVLYKLNLVYHKLDDLNLKISNFEKQFEDINLKLINVEALSIFNNKEEDKKFTNDELSVLLHALEKKLSQKIIFIDNKFSKIDEDILKLKQIDKALEQTNKNLDKLASVEWGYFVRGREVGIVFFFLRL